MNAVLFLFKNLNDEFINTNVKNINELLKNVIEKLNLAWDQAVVEKGKDLTSFAKV